MERIDKINPKVRPEDIVLQEVSPDRVNLLFHEFSLMNVRRTLKAPYKYQLSTMISNTYKGKGNDIYWIPEDKIEDFMFKGYIPERGNSPHHKPTRNKISYRPMPTANENIKGVSGRVFATAVGYLINEFTEPVFHSGIKSPKGLDVSAITQILISAKTLGQFMTEANGWLDQKVRLDPALDLYYLDVPDDDPKKLPDTITEIKLRAWYTQMRAKAKAILMQLQFKYGTISKNSYAWLLERCFSKEFSLKDQSKKSTNVTVKNEVSKPKSSEETEEEDKQTEKAVIELCFSEEPG